jgi:hypothetical protein
MLQVFTYTSGDAALNSKQNSKRGDIVESILNPDSDHDVSDFEQPDIGMCGN